MEWLFGHKKTPAEMLKENQRSLQKAMRCVAVPRSPAGLFAMPWCSFVAKLASAGGSRHALVCLSC